ncbi:hypothetical protein ACVW19_005610 [Streptomyces sp. TE5632]
MGQSGVHDFSCRQLVCEALHVGVVNEIEHARMGHARFENLNEPIVLLLRPVCCHDFANELDELIAIKVTHVHRTSLMVVGVQHLGTIPRSRNCQVIQITDTVAMLNWCHVMQDVLIIFPTACWFATNGAPPAAVRVLFALLKPAARPGSSATAFQKASRKSPNVLKGFPCSCRPICPGIFPVLPRVPLSHPPDMSDRRPPPVTAPGGFLSSVAVLVPVMAGRFFSPSAPRIEVSVSCACRLHPVRPPTPTRAACRVSSSAASAYRSARASQP